ncbi:hypothetical protein ACIQ4I_05450 [Rummeliibacillus sp. NPDC094406]|uniref:hypothetical protein n=1 Tax=Rummeliibacillus sp. NPDC094406 TaxID=3364511 RepID=UPI00381BEAA0
MAKRETGSQLEASVSGENAMILVESKTMRDQHVYRDEILEKVKVIPTLPNTLEITLQMAAEYYEVPVETIRTIVKRHRKEFNEYEELRLLRGPTLNDFKTLVQGEPSLNGINSLQLMNRRGLLRLGMLITESEVAKSVRNYLLNIEEISTEEQRKWAIEREIGKRERRQLTDAIQEFYAVTSKTNKYAIFTNLVYETIFGINAAQLKGLYDVGKNEMLRDFFSTEDLKKIVKVERVIASLLSLDKSYSEIEGELLSKKERYR